MRDETCNLQPEINIEDFNIGFNREIYLDRIAHATGNRLIKVIVGHRRSGKSYIIRQFIRNLIYINEVNPKNAFYLNKELYDFESINTASDLNKLIRLYQKKIKPKGKVYIFIDEIQNI